MWVIRYALILAIIVIFLGFSIQNSYQVTEINILKKQYASVPLILVIYVAFSVGAIFWFFVSLVQHLKVSSRIGQFKKKNKELMEEIKALRNLPLEEVNEQDLKSEDQENG